MIKLKLPVSFLQDFTDSSFFLYEKVCKQMLVSVEGALIAALLGMLNQRSKIFGQMDKKKQVLFW